MGISLYAVSASQSMTPPNVSYFFCASATYFARVAGPT